MRSKNACKQSWSACEWTACDVRGENTIREIWSVRYIVLFYRCLLFILSCAHSSSSDSGSNGVDGRRGERETDDVLHWTTGGRTLNDGGGRVHYTSGEVIRVYIYLRGYKGPPPPPPRSQAPYWFNALQAQQYHLIPCTKHRVSSAWWFIIFTLEKFILCLYNICA